MEKILITGSSGFIGMSLSISLLKSGYDIVGIDNMNDYYDINLKTARLNILNEFNNFSFYKGDITDLSFVRDIFHKHRPDKVVNLAAQAGVRYSLKNPQAYVNSNILGFINILEECRKNKVKGLIYASSSSVYGGNKKIPFSESDNVDKPISIYAVSKKSNELMAYAYSHLYGLRTTGLRFFTVYGPWGRPDMAMYIFTEKICNNEPIMVFNHGNMERDFTYIDDIVDGIRGAIDKNYECDIFNLGNNHSENLMSMIKVIETNLKIDAKLLFKDIQLGDVKKTFANIDHAKNRINYTPKISIYDGVPKFINWYKSYRKVS